MPAHALYRGRARVRAWVAGARRTNRAVVRRPFQVTAPNWRKPRGQEQDAYPPGGKREDDCGGAPVSLRGDVEVGVGEAAQADRANQGVGDWSRRRSMQTAIPAFRARLGPARGSPALPWPGFREEPRCKPCHRPRTPAG